MNSSLQEMDRAQWRASLMAKAIEIAGTASGTPDNLTLVAMFDDELEAFAGYVLDASGRVDAGYRQGWEDVRDALGLRGNLPVSNAQYHASVLMPKLREVIRAATPVPEGWVVDRNEDGEVRVCGPSGSPGGMHPRADSGPLAERLLHALATALIDAAAPQPAGECCDTPAYCSSVRRCTAQDEARAVTKPAGEAKSPADPLPNWCRTCGRLWRDPLGALCPDAIHRRRNSSNPPEPAHSAPADVDVLDWITDDMSGNQIVDQVRIQAQFSRIEDDEIVKALEIALDRLRLSAPASVKDCLTTADVEALGKAIFEAHFEQYVGTSLWPMRGWDEVEQSTRDHWTQIARRLSVQQAGKGEGA